MRTKLIAWGLAGALIAAMAPAVFAQSQPADEPFAWPLEQWRALTPEVDPETPGPQKPPAARVVRKGLRASGAVALTFDDGYNGRACGRIANILRKHDAVGTFFVNGRYLQDQPGRWRQTLEGMEVGNHTRSHRDLTREVHPVVERQIAQNEAIHEQVLDRPMLKVLRPPYGAYGERVGRIAKQLGYDRVVMWNVDTGDWRPNVKAKSIARRATGAPAGSIILMHCARDATVKALPKIIRHYERRGIKLAGLKKVLKGTKGSRRSDGSSRYDQ